MLVTPYGKIKLLFDGREVDYSCNPAVSSRCPEVDGCYRILFEYVPDGNAHELSCLLDMEHEKADPETGENLEAVSFYIGEGKLTLGTEGDFCQDSPYDFSGDLLKKGIEIHILEATQRRMFVFGVCWMESCSEENDTQTWFGADPTLD